LVVVSSAFAANAAAVPPESQTIVVDETFIDTETCDFPLTVHMEGRIKITTHFDQAGNLTFESATPSFRFTVTNPATGKTIRDADVGLDKFTPTPTEEAWFSPPVSTSASCRSRVVPSSRESACS
jgi:hypothetical protein